MSLVHEPTVTLLRRRFVCTFYNAFRGIGWDAEAHRFARSGGGNVRYGGVFTPDGKLVVGFGFDQREVWRALTGAVARHPQLCKPTAEEQAILDGDDALARGRLHFELAQLDKARADLARAADAGSTEARVLLGHLESVDITRPLTERRQRAITQFGKLGEIPADRRDDVIMDLIALRVRLKRAPGFFTGYEFVPGTDLKLTVKRLETLIAAQPQSNRLGQMHFLLGLARWSSGDREGANTAWKTHATRLPGDRFAMLSRIHHTDYVFSPCRKSTLSGRVIDPRSDAERRGDK